MRCCFWRKIFFVVLFITKPCFSIVILVHGSFASDATWSRPYGDFYQELEAQARKIDQKLFAFSWSGKPTVKEIYIASVRLVSLIESYQDEEKIILIGHSHGGNVINLASRFLRDPLEGQSELTEQKWQEILDDFEGCREQDKKNNQVFEMTPEQDIGLSLSFTTRKIEEVDHKKYKIEKVYLLATPVDTVRYNPDMQVIEHLYNFYSLGDLVQTVGGMYGRTYPHDQERICNLLTTIKGAGLFGGDSPTHTSIHSPVVAEWILSLPEILDDDQEICFI